LEVQDDGVGIDENILPFIFDENFSTKDKNKISGVGLSIVKSILQKYEGDINLESEPDKGTKFIIKLPSLSQTTASSVANKKILIAEDENILRELLAELFISYGFEVMTVQNGKELLDIISNNHFDILLVDKKMPELDGVSCIKEIRKSGNQVPIILASGSNVSADGEIIKLVQNIILKPYNFEEILSAVRELVV
jgi:CheY-like chemotaxis protein